MFVKYIQCEECGQRFSKRVTRYLCGCGGVVRIMYDYRGLRKAVSWKKLRDRPFGHYRYKEFFPNTRNVVSLDEGGTALVKSKLKSSVYFKLESQNPSGSFKDRGTTCEISHALDARAKKVVCASTGNMGASVSSYSARAGLDCTIVLPAYATGEKIQQIKNYGARLRKLKGDYTVAMHNAYESYRKGEAYLVGDYAYRGEGEKSVGFEIMDELTPDYIVCPIGNGTLLSATWRGLQEIKLAGLVKKLPKIIGVQAKGCSPVVKAWKTGKPVKPVLPKTIAGAIACGDPIDGEQVVRSVKASKGKLIAVTDKEIVQARRKLAREEGIDGEPSGVVSYAGLGKLKLGKKKAVCIVSGNGLKDLKHV
ncbi:MAG: threonine synthase [Candidatus Nanoarchaeia archaeon]